MNDAAIHDLLSRLARHHPSGGRVIERAALLAAGSDFPQVLAWISDHGGRPEELVAPVTAAGGLHGSRVAGGGARSQQAPLRYVLDASALD